MQVDRQGMLVVTSSLNMHRCLSLTLTHDAQQSAASTVSLETQLKLMSRCWISSSCARVEGSTATKA